MRTGTQFFAVSQRLRFIDVLANILITQLLCCGLFLTTCLVCWCRLWALRCSITV